MKNFLLFLLTMLALGASPSPLHAGTHTWSGAQNGLWSQPGNWSSGGAPAPGEAAPVVLNFPNSAVRRESTNNITGLELDSLNITGDDYLLAGVGGGRTIRFNGLTRASPNQFSISCSATNNSVDQSLEFALQTSCSLYAAANCGLNLFALLSGPGSLTKFGPGEIWLYGREANTFAGAFTVLDGGVNLSAFQFDGWFGGSPQISVPGVLIIGDTNLAAKPRVTALEHGQHPLNARVIINPSGTLEVSGAVFAASDLRMTGGKVLVTTNRWCDGGSCWAQPGTLSLSHGIVAYPTPLATAVISGVSESAASPCKVTFDADTNDVSIDVTAANLVVDAVMQSWSPLIKKGAGTLVLQRKFGFDYDDAHLNEGVVLLHGSEAELHGTHLTLAAGAQIVIDGPCTARADLTLNGFGTNGDGAIVVQHPGASWYSGVVTAATDTAIAVVNPQDTLYFDVYGDLAGGGSLKKKGRGALTLANDYHPATNSLTGTVYVEQGTLALTNVPGGINFTSPLLIGPGTPSTGTARVKLLTWGLLNDTSPITVLASGTLDLNGFADTVGPLTLSGGSVITGPAGQLFPAAGIGVSNQPASFASGISGRLYTYTNVTIDVASNNSLSIDAEISDLNQLQGGFTKKGQGTLRLLSSNLFRGPLTVEAGTLSVEHNVALGSTLSGTSVENGARLQINDGVQIGLEPLGLRGDGGGLGAFIGIGTNSWAGSIVLSGDAVTSIATNSQTSLNGVIVGAGGLVKSASGNLILGGTGNNAFTGTTVVQQGTLTLNKSNALAIAGPLIVGDGMGATDTAVVRSLRREQIADTAPVTVATDGQLDLSATFSLTETIGSLAGSGTVSLGLNAILVTGTNNTDARFDGKFTGFGPSSLVKQGSGKWTVGGINDQFQGSATVNGGRLELAGSLPIGPITVNTGGKLTGDGLASHVTSLGGMIRPGCCPGLMKLSLRNLSFNSASTFYAHLDGTNASPTGTAFSQAAVTGTVNLGGATLQASLGFQSAVSNQFIIIDNDGSDAVIGTFAGLPEGASFTSSGAGFLITYRGGDGNDVALTQLSVPTPPQFGRITALGNGTAEFTGTGTPGLTYTVQGNVDLNTTNWSTLGTVTAASATGLLQFIDTDAPNHPMRFYRFVLP